MKMGVILNHPSQSAFAERAWASREVRLRRIAVEVNGDVDEFRRALKVAIEERRVKKTDIVDCTEIVTAMLPKLDGIRQYRPRRRKDTINRHPAFYRALTATESAVDVETAVIVSICQDGKIAATMAATATEYADVDTDQCTGCVEVADSLGLDPGAIKCKECMESVAKAEKLADSVAKVAETEQIRKDCELCQVTRDNNLGESCTYHA